MLQREQRGEGVGGGWVGGEGEEKWEGCGGGGSRRRGRHSGMDYRLLVSFTGTIESWPKV